MRAGDYERTKTDQRRGKKCSCFNSMLNLEQLTYFPVNSNRRIFSITGLREIEKDVQKNQTHWT